MDWKLFDYVGNLVEFMECYDSGEYDEYGFAVIIRLDNTTERWMNYITISKELLEDQPENIQKLMTRFVSNYPHFKEVAKIVFSKEYTDHICKPIEVVASSDFKATLGYMDDSSDNLKLS